MKSIRLTDGVFYIETHGEDQPNIAITPIGHCHYLDAVEQEDKTVEEPNCRVGRPRKNQKRGKGLGEEVSDLDLATHETSGAQDL